MSAVELVSMDSDISVFNEFTDENDAMRHMAEVHIIDEIDYVHPQVSMKEVVPKLPRTSQYATKIISRSVHRQA
jgi:hypothetical protein